MNDTALLASSGKNLWKKRNGDTVLPGPRRKEKKASLPLKLTKRSTMSRFVMGRTSDASDRLIKAALDLMWEESYGAITIDDICKRANVKKGSFYYFYESKADLAVAALDSLWLSQWKPSLDTYFSPSLEPLERLRGYLAASYERQARLKAETGKVLGCPVFSLGSEMGTQDEKVAAKVREIISRKRRYFESAIRDGMADGSMEPGDPAEKVMCLVGMVEGVLGQARIMNDPEPLRTLPETAVNMLRAKKPAATRT